MGLLDCHDTSCDKSHDCTTIDCRGPENGEQPDRFARGQSVNQSKANEGIDDCNQSPHETGEGCFGTTNLHSRCDDGGDDEKTAPDECDGKDEEEEGSTDASNACPEALIEPPTPENSAAGAQQEAHPEEDPQASIAQKTCYDCVFWRGEHTGETRAGGCHIYYAVSLDHSKALPDIVPSEDGDICNYFSEGSGENLSCFDCKQWPEEKKYYGKRRECCLLWDKVLADNCELQSATLVRFGLRASFTVFNTDSPATDCDICTNFSLRENRTPAPRMKIVETNVIGIGFNNRVAIWEHEANSKNKVIALQRDAGNLYDKNAVAVFLNDQHAGFLPKNDAAIIAELMDAGSKAFVADHMIKRIEKGNGNVYYYVSLIVAIETPKETGAETPKEIPLIADTATTVPIDVHPALTDDVDKLDALSAQAMEPIRNLKL